MQYGSRSSRTPSDSFLFTSAEPCVTCKAAAQRSAQLRNCLSQHLRHILEELNLDPNPASSGGSPRSNIPCRVLTLQLLNDKAVNLDRIGLGTPASTFGHRETTA